MRHKVSLLLIFFTGVFPMVAQNQPVDGAAVMSAACISCHSLRIIANARRSRAAWTSTVGDMIQRGAPVFPDEIAPLINYLAETLGPQAAGASPPKEEPRKKTDAQE